MELALSPQDQAFRQEVRAFLADALTPPLRAASARQAGVFADGDLNARWHKILHARGWAAPSWPKQFGGTGWSEVQRYIFASECAEAGAPVLPAMGLQMCGPVLMRFGTPDQKAFFLPKILSGEHYWCQGYSEPGAGSDLASLKCRAVRDGDDYVINGSKIWTTHAQYASWMFLLVRTSNEGRPQAGVTFLLLDMKTPGISVRPILSMSGEHEVNEVFFDNVRTPAALRVGEENQGWLVAKHLLEFERGGAYAPRVRALLNEVRDIAKQEQSDAGGPLWRDPDFQRKYCALDCELIAVEWTEKRIVSGMSAGQNVGDAAASMLKLAGSELLQRVTELAMEALGEYAAADQRAALRGDAAPIGPAHAMTPTARYLNARAWTIFGGSSEIQRNILARAALGL